MEITSLEHYHLKFINFEGNVLRRSDWVTVSWLLWVRTYPQPNSGRSNSKKIEEKSTKSFNMNVCFTIAKSKEERMRKKNQPKDPTKT